MMCPPVIRWNNGNYLLSLWILQSYNTMEKSLTVWVLYSSQILFMHMQPFVKIPTLVAQCSHIHCRLLASPWTWYDLWVIFICIFKCFSKHTNMLEVLSTFHSVHLDLVTFKPKKVLEKVIWDDPGEQYFCSHQLHNNLLVCQTYVDCIERKFPWYYNVILLT